MRAPIQVPSNEKTSKMNAYRMLIIVSRPIICGLGALLLAACGGGGGDSAPPVTTVPPPVAELSLLGPDYGEALPATECGTALGSARQARYPAPPGFSRILRTPMVMRADGAGGLLVAQDDNVPTNGQPVSGQGMYRVDATGAKTLLSLPYTRVFDIGPDGTIWYAQVDGVFATETLSGQGTVLTIQQGYAGAPVDGPLAAVPLGFVSLIAAGRERVYVLVAGDHSLSDHTNAFQGMLPGPSNFSLRIVTRAANGTATVQTLPLPAGLDDAFYIRGMRVDANDNLVLLANAQYKQSLGMSADGSTANYLGEASVWTRSTTGNWAKLAAKTYPSARFVPPCCVSSLLFGLDFDDLSLAPDGRIWVSGGSFGAIDSVGADGTWTTIAQLDGHEEDRIGLDGDIAQAAFRFAYQPVATGDGVLFYDSGTCQIRKLAGGRLSTFSGPLLSAQPTFARKRLLGSDPQGRLLFTRLDKWLGSFDLATQVIETLDSRGIVLQQAADRGCVSSNGIGGASANPCRFRFADPAVTMPRIWAGLDAGSPIFSLSTTDTLAPNATLQQWQGRDDSRLLSAAINWPGVLNGAAPFNFAGGFHVTGGKALLFGTVRTDPPIAPQIFYETRVYQIDLATGQALPLAGRTIASAAFNQKSVDLDPVSTIGARPVFVQKRGDGGYWLVNAKEVWLLDADGNTRRVAGSRTTGATGVDGTGDAVSFAFISAARVLPDDRLLVADRDAHAIRIVDAQGRVSTLVGRLNQPGLITGPLPAGLSAPVDVLPSGKDLLITSDKLLNLIRVTNVL